MYPDVMSSTSKTVVRLLFDGFASPSVEIRTRTS